MKLSKQALKKLLAIVILVASISMLSTGNVNKYEFDGDVHKHWHQVNIGNLQVDKVDNFLTRNLLTYFILFKSLFDKHAYIINYEGSHKLIFKGQLFVHPNHIDKRVVEQTNFPERLTLFGMLVPFMLILSFLLIISACGLLKSFVIIQFFSFILAIGMKVPMSGVLAFFTYLIFVIYTFKFGLRALHENF